MTESEWRNCTDPTPMLKFLVGRASERKLRLFAVACCRRIWQLLPDERSRQAVSVAERYADAQATEDELEAASDAACAVVWYADTVDLDDTLPYSSSLAAYNVAVPVGWWGAAPAFVAPYEITRDVAPNRDREGAAQCNLIRDIFGNPFRPMTMNPNWIAWNDGMVRNMAAAIYADRAFEQLPILADALEDAGCDNADILNHCRQPGVHVRGCWVIDLLLGKE